MAVPNHFSLLKSYFDEHKHQYNFILKSHCGLFTERFLVHLREKTNNLNFKHLRKYNSATQYNKHAIDVIAYDNRGASDGTPIMEVDILANAETAHASASWQDKNTTYEPKDLMEPEEIDIPQPKTVPWVDYNEQGFERLKKLLAYDYGRRPQGPDYDVSVWAARVFHSTYMRPDGVPLGMESALRKHRPEWCSALGISVDDNWNP